MERQDELLALRALIEKQKTELAEKERVIEEQKAHIEEQKVHIEEQDSLIARQNIQIENMIQALLHARKKLFGASTEATRQTEGQLTLFDDMWELARQLETEQKKTTVKSYTRTARKPGVRAEMLAGLPKEVEEYIIPAEETCHVCGGRLKVIGRRIVRTEVELQPAKLTVK